MLAASAAAMPDLPHLLQQCRFCCELSARVDELPIELGQALLHEGSIVRTDNAVLELVPLHQGIGSACCAGLDFTPQPFERLAL